MKKTLSFLFSLTLFIALTAIETRADLASPKPSPGVPKVVLQTSLVVEPDSKGYEARLQISEGSLREIRAALSDGASSGTTRSISQNSTRTILAGLSLFLALSFGGVWLARSTGRQHKTIAAVLVLSGFLGAAAIVTHGNAGPPPSYLWRNITNNLNEGKSTQGPIEVEVVPGESGVKLIIPLKKNRPGD
jgi:hypothetical protein